MDCYFCNFYVRLPSKWTRSGEFCIVLYREILTRWKLNRCLELAKYYSSLVSIICWELDWWRNLNRVSLCILKPYKNFICWLIKNEYCKAKEPPGGGSFFGVFIFLDWMSHIRSWTRAHIQWSWVRHHRNGVRFPKRPQNVSRSFSFVSNPSHCEGFSNVPFLGAMSHILKRSLIFILKS